MPRILILANQTASSPELTNAIREIIKKDAGTEFVLLVPATPMRLSLSERKHRTI